MGGAEIFAHQLAYSQIKLYPDSPPLVLYQKLKGPLVDHYPQLQKIQAPRRWSPRRTVRLIKLFHRADRILFHGFYPQLLFLALISNRQTFYFVHGARVLSSPTLTAIKKTITHKQKPRFSGITRRLKKQWLQFALRHCHKVFAPSDCYRNFAIKTYRIPEKNIQTCALGIDTRRFKNISAPLYGQQDRVIGCIASFRPIKQIEKLVFAFSELYRQQKADRLYLIGDGEEKQRIRTMIGEMGLSEQVSLIDATQHLEPYIKQFDVFVLTSKFESFSLVLLEAMYLECPVIVFSDSGGAAELVKKTQGGFVATDQDDLVTKISYLLQNHSIRQKLGQQGRLAVQSSYLIKHTAQNLHSMTRISCG